jgi:hypothetical protein
MPHCLGAGLDFLVRVAMARLTGARHVEQWATDLVVADLDRTLALVWHVAISARHSAAGVDPLIPQLEFGMLGLQDRRSSLPVHIVGELLFVVVAFDLLGPKPLVPRVSNGLLASFEVVFHMALAANETAHLLAGGQGVDIVFLFVVALVPVRGPLMNAGQVRQLG